MEYQFKNKGKGKRGREKKNRFRAITAYARHHKNKQDKFNYVPNMWNATTEKELGAATFYYTYSFLPRADAFSKFSSGISKQPREAGFSLCF